LRTIPPDQLQANERLIFQQRRHHKTALTISVTFFIFFPMDRQTSSGVGPAHRKAYTLIYSLGADLLILMVDVKIFDFMVAVQWKIEQIGRT
jgi:hypothetical protein